MAHVFDAVIRLKDQFSAQLKNVNENLTKFQKKTKYIGQSVGQVSKALGKTGKKMTTSLTLPLLGIGTAAAKIGMDFEASMSNVSALSGATGTDLKQLETAARNAGAKTSKSAKDAADALGYMAL